MIAPTSSHFFIAKVVAAYWVTSVLLVFANKVVLSGTEFSMPAPLFVTWFQCVFTAALVYGLGIYSDGAVAGSQFVFPQQTLDIATAIKVLPLSVIFVGMITFNNMCLMHVEVSFYNIARALTVVMNVVLSYVFLGTSTSPRAVGALAVVVIGFVVGTEGEVNFSFIGTVFGVLSSLFVSLNSIFTKRAMPFVNDDMWRLTFVNNVNAAVMFVPCIVVFGEMETIKRFQHLLFSPAFWVLMCAAGGLGFAIGIVTMMQIKYTSPLTHNVSGTAKACAQSLLAFVIWKNPVTAGALLGMAMVLGGSLLYAIVRINETPAAPPPVIKRTQSEEEGKQKEPKV